MYIYAHKISLTLTYTHTHLCTYLCICVHACVRLCTTYVCIHSSYPFIAADNWNIASLSFQNINTDEIVFVAQQSANQSTWNCCFLWL